MAVAAPELDKARTTLDAHVRDIIQWHFSPETGCPFWLQWAEKAGWDPRKEVKQYEDLDKFRSLPGRMAARRTGATLGAARI